MEWSKGKQRMAAAALLVPALVFALAPRAMTLAASPPPAAAATALDTALAAYEAGDYRAARAGLKPLADRGSAIAETLMGVMAAEGQGGAADPAAAAGWWLRAANRGYAPAQLALAKALAGGHGVARDPGAALVWAQLAADGGNGAATGAQTLATGLAKGFDAGQLAQLEDERAAWRPWPG